MLIAIVGSAGRGEDARKWNPTVYRNCFNHLDKQLLADVPIAERHLVSGGAAWADHLAVSLFLAGKAGELHLHFPCQFHIDEEDNWFWSRKLSVPGFADSGVRDSKLNPGGTLNYYHRVFSEAMEANTMAGIARAIGKQAVINVHYPVLEGSSPFHVRNLAVGKNLTRLYAFTWSTDNKPKPGGTRHCWDNASGQKLHIALDTMR